MVSLGLAWAAGQKNAQDAASGKVKTILDMRKAQKEMAEIDEYFDPVNTASREYSKEQKAKLLKNYQTFEKYASKASKDPNALADYMTEQTGDKWSYIKGSKGEIILRNEKGDVASFDSAAEAIDHIRTNYLIDTPTQVKEMSDMSKLRAQKMMEHSLKLDELYKKGEIDISTYRQTKAVLEPYLAQLRNEGMFGAAHIHGKYQLGAAEINAASRIKAAELKDSAEQKKLALKNAEHIATIKSAQKLGLSYDKDSKTYKKFMADPKDKTGKTGSWVDMNKSDLAEFEKQKEAYTLNIMHGADYGVDPFTSAYSMDREYPLSATEYEGVIGNSDMRYGGPRQANIIGYGSAPLTDAFGNELGRLPSNLSDPSRANGTYPVDPDFILRDSMMSR